MNKIRVLLADDHTIVRKGIRALLQPADDIEVIAEVANGHEAVTLVDEVKPDVVLMDVTMPRLNGLEATRQIKNKHDQVKIVILTMHANEQYILPALQAGASGFIVKNATPEEMMDAIRMAYQGNYYMSPTVSKTVIEEYLRTAGIVKSSGGYDLLTSREKEIFQLVVEGHSVKEISKLLVITEKTTRAHRLRVMKKLKVNSVPELTLYAIRIGLIEPE